MEPITIKLRERSSTPRTGEPLRFGVPLGRGDIFSLSDITVQDSDGRTLRAQISSLAKWPDASHRWICIEAQVPPGMQAVSELFLVQKSGTVLDNPIASIADDERSLTINLPDRSLILDHTSPAWTVQSRDLESQSGHMLHLEDRGFKRCIAELEQGWSLVSNGPVSCEVSSSGWWLDSNKERLARFDCRLTIYGDGLVLIDSTIHNPRRARHPGGLWDLGDPGSIHFGAMYLEVDYKSCHSLELSLSPEDQPKKLSAASPVILHQESSGGEYWNSTNHMNANSDVPLRYRGYRLTTGDDTLAAGNRASPVLLVEPVEGEPLCVSMPKFWQNFPASLEASQERTRASLYPADTSEPYELQGGERKTQRIVLGLGKKVQELQWSHSPLVPTLSAEHYERTGAFPWFRAHQPANGLDELIQEGLEGASNFFTKRERIDEFGWRNFGDIFADHETLYQKPDETPFNTHYNNQYDAIYGFARQFAHSGDTRWYELMDDLARHVVDIDIYHTTEDRAEYNNGLFWHTDHYLDAHTCTHRTFTRHNTSSSTPGQLGGGPAAEHCYTTGLLYHYWMTGAAASREAVLELTHWMETLHQGQRGLLAEVLALKKQELPKLKAMLRGDQVSPHRYPFTRGTGNYITALLDAHLLEPSNGWLQRAEAVIHQTIHPGDDIEQRDLLDTETGWSYLILLASIARYLHIKEEAGEEDQHWHYARDSYLHYTEWMLAHEEPFLLSSSELEFANDTWTAQDTRKAMLLYLAAIYNPSQAKQYRQKADEWLNYVTARLRSSLEREFTRVQVILLQNQGPHSLATASDKNRFERTTGIRNYRTPSLKLLGLLRRITARIIRGLISFRPARERDWLQTRLDR